MPVFKHVWFWIAAAIVGASCLVGWNVGKAIVAEDTPTGFADTALVPPTPTPEADTPPIAEPVQLEIPRLGSAASVEYVGLDDQRRMDVPKDAANVAWYKFGARPGEVGNAVLAGHLDSETGPAVFYDLESLEPGNTIFVTDSAGARHEFRVTDKQTYAHDKFPMDEVFGASDKRRLNLITCEGQFDAAAKNYSHRTVVYTEAVDVVQ